MTWQPLETAPKDGSELLLALYDNGALVWICNGNWRTSEYAYGKSSEMSVTGWHIVSGYPLRQPTHWQPLPPPPQDEGKD